MTFDDFFLHDFFHEKFRHAILWLFIFHEIFDMIYYDSFCHQMALYARLNLFSWLLIIFFDMTFFHEKFRHAILWLFIFHEIFDILKYDLFSNEMTPDVIICRFSWLLETFFISTCYTMKFFLWQTICTMLKFNVMRKKQCWSQALLMRSCTFSSRNVQNITV